MSLTEPLYLLLLLLIPLGWLAMRAAAQRRRRYAVRLPTAGMAATLVRRAPAWRRIAGPGLLAAAVAALALALARPEVTVAVPVERASVMLVTDASGSMRAADVAPTRLDAAREAIDRFLEEAPPQMRVGLMAYSANVETLQTPTTDRDVVRESAGTISAGGGTATGDALAEALRRLRPEGEQDPPPAAIVLLSDGMTSEGVDPIGVAERARDMGITVSTVALGTPDGTVQLSPGGFARPVPPDPETLKRIADISGGEAFSVDDAGELASIYERLGTKLGTRDEQREVTAGFAGAGAVLLAAGLAFGLRRRGTVAV